MAVSLKHSSLLQRQCKKSIILAHRQAPDIPGWATLPRSTRARSAGQNISNAPLPTHLANNRLFMKCFKENQF